MLSLKALWNASGLITDHLENPRILDYYRLGKLISDLSNAPSETVLSSEKEWITCAHALIRHSHNYVLYFEFEVAQSHDEALIFLVIYHVYRAGYKHEFFDKRKLRFDIEKTYQAMETSREVFRAEEAREIPKHISRISSFIRNRS